MNNQISEKSIIIFDGICNLCNRLVDFIIRKDKKNRFVFAANQSESGKKILAQYNLDFSIVDTIYLIENNQVYSRSTAVLKIIKQLSFPWNWLYIFIIIPRFIREPIYRLIARNRYRWFGIRTSCRVPTAEERDRFLD
jgi:predicted DCC family thiol-disulfide oxidoreductase YuxK